MKQANQQQLRKPPQATNIPSATSTSSEMLNTREAAAFLGLKEATLRGWRMEGSGPPFFTMGVTKHRGVRYDRSDLERFKSERRCVPSVRHMGRYHAAVQEAA